MGEGGRLLLPAAGGEALDKLSILDIKLRRIRDARKLANVRRERDALLERLPPGFQDGAMADIYLRLVEARPRPLRGRGAVPALAARMYGKLRRPKQQCPLCAALVLFRVPGVLHAARAARAAAPLVA